MFKARVSLGIFVVAAIVQTSRREPGRVGYSPRGSSQYQIIDYQSSIINENDVFRNCDDVAVFWAETLTNFRAVFTRKDF